MNFDELILALDDRAIQKILREVEKDELANALKGTGSEVQDKIYRNLSRRAAAFLKSTVDNMWSRRKEDMEKDQQKVTDIIRRLNGAGEIITARASDELVIEPEEEKLSRVEKLVNSIEDAIQQNGVLQIYSFYGIKAADMESAFAYFENRQEDLAHITSLSIPADLLVSSEPLLKIGALETLEIQSASRSLKDTDSIGDDDEERTLLPESTAIINCLKLKEVKLSAIAKLPEWLRCLPALGSLTLSGIKTALPDWISELFSLRSLTFESMYEEESLSDTIENLPALSELTIRWNNIAFIPKAIGNLTSLKKLTVQATEITALPDTIGNLTSLVSLDLSYNKELAALPESIGSLASLKELDVSNCRKLRSLPDTIGNLHSLERLYLHSTKLLRLLESIGDLRALQNLQVHHTPLVYLPESLGNLKRLTDLNISYTPLKMLPKSMDGLAALDSLNISGTGIELTPSLTAAVKTIVNDVQRKLVKETGTLTYTEFVNGYYRTIQCVLEASEKARREGILALEEGLDSFRDGYFKEGIRLLIDGINGDTIRFILSNQSEREPDEYRKKLMEIQLEGILGIQAGCNPPMLMILLNSMVCIPDDHLTKLCGQYLNGYSLAFEDIDFPIEPEKETEREEICSIKRAAELAEKARREGILALEGLLDKDSIAKRDILEYGLCFVLDGEPKESIEKILGNLIEHENDPWKKNLLKAKKTAVLAIQTGDNPRIMVEELLSCFGSDVRAIVEKEMQD